MLGMGVGVPHPVLDGGGTPSCPVLNGVGVSHPVLAGGRGYPIMSCPGKWSYPILSCPVHGVPHHVLSWIGGGGGNPILSWLGYPLSELGCPLEGTWDQCKYYGMEMGYNPPPPPCEQTENVTFPILLIRAVKTGVSIVIDIKNRCTRFRSFLLCVHSTFMLKIVFTCVAWFTQPHQRILWK